MAKSQCLVAQRLKSTILELKKIRKSSKLSRLRIAELDSAIKELEGIAQQLEVQERERQRSNWYKLVSRAIGVLGKVTDHFCKN